MPSKKDETQDTTEQPTERTFSPGGEIFFFPNTGEGEGRSYEAASREEAERLNQTYLDGLHKDDSTDKETN